MTPEQIRRVAFASAELTRRFFDENAELVSEVGRRIAERIHAGGRMLAFGNGGSAADAQHFASELVVRFLRKRSALPALALTTDPSVITAASNDLGFELVFARQLEAHGRPGDVAFGITTSGRSPNVVRAFEAARAQGLLAVALTGRGGGDLRDRLDLQIDVMHDETPRIQEVHGLVIHVLSQIIEEIACP
ncbi:MAG: SIS domain-containing protein [Vicinamibacteria bacterium]|nr:SIS domain-containing protein [Vicinamibacteria bacterium]